VSSGDEANTTDKTYYSTWAPCWLLCITHEIDRLASADSDFVGMCVHHWWKQRYGRRHRHRFCRCVYARPYCMLMSVQLSSESVPAVAYHDAAVITTHTHTQRMWYVVRWPGRYGPSLDTLQSAVTSRTNTSTREASTEARSQNRCCGCGQAIGIVLHDLSVSVASGIQHAQRHITVCGQSDSTVFPHIISQKIKSSERSCRTQNVCCDFVHKFCVKHFSFFEKNL